ncbi:hypothetical protein DEU56DRAFT_944224 [Suillus clintonianus]|uniref:uncharacterized protein n=1 Tax=Suillus clintonianus TaxID=1904413 RepID=UPI001B8850B9|nr:uncharacterized protein DEU56DRAFT_944224 [Suillus clintonianus]KAG2139297.1 hypothetical protein DEU56DRAFT_944224 [Suillus clintonianus]
MPASQTRGRRRVVRDVPIIRQPGLNVAGHSSADQLGCTSEIPESMGIPELPPHIYPPPVFSHDGYSSMPPNSQDSMPLPRASHFSGTTPRAPGPDRVQRSFAPSGDTASRYRMVYAYLPLRGGEKSRQEYTDGVVYRDDTTGVQKSTTRRYQLPPVRPPRESHLSDSETTPIATTSQRSTSVRAGRRYSQGDRSGTTTTTVPLIDKNNLKIIMKDAKDAIIKETLNRCGFHDSSSRLSVVQAALTDACSSVIGEEHLIKLWIDENTSGLYKTVITPMSTILNRFKQCAQDLVETLYRLQMSIWADPVVQANHIKSTIDFLTGNNSLNFIFGESVKIDGRELRYPFEHEAIIQIAKCAAFRDGYGKFIDSDSGFRDLHGCVFNDLCMLTMLVLAATSRNDTPLSPNSGHPHSLVSPYPVISASSLINCKLPVHSLNKLESLALDTLSHDLTISPAAWRQWLSHLLHTCSPSARMFSSIGDRVENGSAGGGLGEYEDGDCVAC